MKVALAQISPKLSKENIEKHLELIENARLLHADVVVFPELSLNGYKMMDSVVENSFDISELNILKELSLSLDICVGVALKVGNEIYNCGIYFSKNEIVHIHRKNILPNYLMFEEARFFFKGSELTAFNTLFGKAVLLICEDLWSSEMLFKVSQICPDIIYVISNSPARDFLEDGLLIQEQWMALLKSVSILNGAYTVFVNRVGFEDGMGFWGGSMLISPRGEILGDMAKFEEGFEIFELNNKITKNQKYLLRNR